MNRTDTQKTNGNYFSCPLAVFHAECLILFDFILVEFLSFFSVTENQIWVDWSGIFLIFDAVYFYILWYDVFFIII